MPNSIAAQPLLALTAHLTPDLIGIDAGKRLRNLWHSQEGPGASAADSFDGFDYGSTD